MNHVDRYAMTFLIGITVLAVILSLPRRYIWFEDTGTPHESMGATPPPQALDSVKERAAANALQSAGFIAVDPHLKADGALQARIVTSVLSECVKKGISSSDPENMISYTAESIIAIEQFNRPRVTQFIKNELAVLSYHVLGRVIPVSLGVGQVRMKRFRSLLFSGWTLPDVPMPLDRRSQLEFLLDECKNAAAVGGIVELEFKRDPAPEVADVAREYNGKARSSAGFEYEDLVDQAYQLLAAASAG